MKPIIKDNGKHVIPTPMCGKCGCRLHFYHYINDYNVPCYNPRIITENFCPNCGEIVEHEEEE